MNLTRTTRHRRSVRTLTRRAPLTLLALLCLTAPPGDALAADPPVLWQEVPTNVFNDPLPGFWTTKVELSDINNDGLVDILFANVGGYQAGTPDSFLSNQAFVNEGGTKFTDVSVAVFGEDPNNPGKAVEDTGRVIKAYDLDDDGDTDIVVGTTWASKSRLYLNDGGGVFTEMSDLLPSTPLSAGDLEVGDVDGDGDLDIVISDWGEAPVGFVNSPGGVTRLWLNDGGATFTDATPTQMPAIPVNWSWDHEFADVDNDFDLDLLIACRACSGGSFLLVNDGAGNFDNGTPGNLPQAVGNVDFEVIDIDGDDYVDTYTLQDGTGFRNRILLNTQKGGFVDKSPLWWAPIENPSSFDYAGLFLDYDSDGMADILLGSFAKNPDRLLRNTGVEYKRVTDPAVYNNVPTDGTYTIAAADLNGDTKLDIVFGEGENYFRNRVFFGEDVAPDTAAPIIGNFEIGGALVPGGEFTFQGRIHDGKTPNRSHDWFFVGIRYVTDGGDINNPADVTEYDLDWYGEHLWRTQLDNPLVLPDFETVVELQICAIDAAMNETCVALAKQFLCGDGIENSPNEQCDDGNQTPGDGCEPDCSITVGCGNGIVEGGEECDDGNNVDGDGCEADCTVTNATTTTTTTTTATESDSDSDSDTITTTDNSATATETAATMSTTDMSASDDDSATTFVGELDDDGCGCTTGDSRGAGTSLLLLGLLALRRRRR